MIEPPQRAFRALVALDPAARASAALEAIASLAAGVEAELVGLFIEDAALLQLTELPFLREVMLGSGSERGLDRGGLERQLRMCAREMQRSFEESARHMQMRASFQIRRGEPVAEILRAASEVDLLVLCRRRRGAGLRSWHGAEIQNIANQAPRTVVFVQQEWATGRSVLAVYDGSPAADRALVIAQRVARKDGLDLRVLVPAFEDGVDDGLRQRAAQVVGSEQPRPRYLLLPDRSIDTLARLSVAEAARAIVFPRSPASLGEDTVRALLDRLDASLVLVD